MITLSKSSVFCFTKLLIFQVYSIVEIVFFINIVNS